MEESKRITKLRGEIISAIPKFPNNRETKTQLEEMSLTTLLIHYLSWMSHYISVKSRKVVIEPTVTNDSRWPKLKGAIEGLLEKVRTGESLAPHLSIQSHLRGYTPAASEKGPNVNRWADKDFLLNSMGYHHFHIGTEFDKKGHVKRSDADEVLFARVTREEFTAIGIFDHSVFESSEEEMTAERKRLWEIFDENRSRGVPPGSVIVSSHIATSGHPVHLVNMAQLYSRIIRDIDPKLDNADYIKTLYSGAEIETPKKPKLEWAFHFSDLSIREKNLNHFFVQRRGFN